MVPGTKRPPLRRRRFLRIIGFGAFFGLIGRFLWVKDPKGDKKLILEARSIPEGGAILIPNNQLAVIRLDKEILALDLTCTHLGCIVRATPQGFLCPCHGSAFSCDGSVIKGPAPRGLLRLPLERSGNTVVVFLSRKGMDS